MTEVFIDSTFGTNKHGYELYYVFTEQEGTRLTAWLTALRATGLNPNVVHTDKDFAEVTAASLAFERNNDRYNHHLCLWHSLRAIHRYITGKIDSIDNTRNSTWLTALPQYLHFLWSQQCTQGPSANLAGHDKAALLSTLAPEDCSIRPIKKFIAARSNKCWNIASLLISRNFLGIFGITGTGPTSRRWKIASICSRPGSKSWESSRRIMCHYSLSPGLMSWPD
ncbi:uncharacterized protein V1513DRAFT_460071 [Lipomyces chichibuensis]|uniref:uncharacterized protein n=1 Tax=Lipomyces chichibuensis TaxID=1546026 RepID=UPI0033438E06